MIDIISEIGINHNNDLQKALELIEKSASSGANIAKFQYYKAGHLYPKSAGSVEWKDNEKEYKYNIYDASIEYELNDDWITPLIEKCDEVGIEFMASVFHKDGLDYLLSKGMKRIKISSSNITNLPLIEYCAKTKLPLYISTGGATLAEVSEAVEMALLYNQQITILHCNLEYPVELNNVNMGVLDTFRYAFPNIKIGFSDHTKEIYEASEQAILLGATCIEKHITFDKEAEGPDHFFAITPEELKILVDKAVNAVKLKDSKQFNINQEIYGSSSVVCNDNEKPVREFGYSTLFVNKDIKKGDVITEQDILILRKAKKDRGLEPKYISLFIDNQVVAKSDISFEDSIKWEHIL